jgi:hypothetical protein
MLSERYVEAIFTRMLVRYGTAWTRMWEDIPMDAVKADWATEIGQASGEAIRYALDHLPPDRPPNVAQFKALMLNRPTKGYVELPRPEATPEEKQRVRELLAKARQAITRRNA